MGVSFKVAKTGTRFRPKAPQAEISVDDAVENSKESPRVFSGNESSAAKRKTNVSDAGEEVGGFSVSSTCSGGRPTALDHEVSFTLDLFPNGFSIGTAEKSKVQPVLHDNPKSLHPYDRKSETLFSAIESGLLPGDILDDIPGKYVDGTIICEVRDYRKCVSEPGSCTLDGCPIINKVHLRMSLENIVKDIPSISDDSWTYSDLMEVESRTLKALQPQLCLDPTPMMDRLCCTNKLDLGIFTARRKRLRQMAEVTVPSNSQASGKKISIDKAPENGNCRPGDSGLTVSGDAALQHIRTNLASQHPVSSSMPALQPKSFGQHVSRPTLPSSSHSKIQAVVGYPRSNQDRVAESPANTPAAGADLINSYTDTINCGVSFQGKRENPDTQMSPLSSTKRLKQTPLAPDSSSIQQQQVGQSLDSVHGTDVHWQNPLFHQQYETRGVQYANIGGQKYADPRQSTHGGAQNQDAGVPFYLEQQGMRYGVKEERFELENLEKQELEKNKDNPHMLATESTQLDQQRVRQQQFMKPHFTPHMAWQNLNDPRKDELQKRKSAQSPRVSTGAVGQSPLSSKLGEIPNVSLGAHIGTVATAAAVGPQKEKALGVTNAAVGTPSTASSPSDSMQRQHQATMPAKRRSNSLPRTPAISGVGSPPSVSNMSAPFNANSPSIGTTTMADQAIRERFSKIEMLTQRYQLNCKKNKVDNYTVRKPITHLTQHIAFCLENSLSLEDLKDAITTMPMSKSLVGGSMNVCKSRVLNFMRMERMYQGNGVIAPFRNKLVLLERPNDGTVAMQYGGDIDDVNFTTLQDHGPTLPNTHYADLLAAQFRSLMVRDGYQEADDQILPRPTSTGLSTAPSMSDSMVAEMQFPEAAGGQPVAAHPSGVVTTANCSNPSVNPSQNLLAETRMLPPGNTQALQMSQGYLPGIGMPTRPQLDQASLQQQHNQPTQIQQQQQQQHQQPQMQRSSSLFHPSNQLSHLNAVGQNPNLQMGNHMVNKPTLQQLQMLQQQQQQHHQSQNLERRKIMAAVGMGNMGNVSNNMVGLGGLSNVVGIGGVRGMGPSMSSPMGPMSGLGNMNQNQMNPSQISNISSMLSQQLRPGPLSNLQAAQATLPASIATKLRMAHNRAGMMGGLQPGITGMSGNNQMHVNSAGLSMLGQTLNRGNMNPLQRNMMASMGPPKAQGTSFYMNQQQQQVQFQQQQLQQQQQQQMQPQQPPLGSPLQHQQSIVSQPQACSPSAMAMQQQLGSPSQASLQTPMSPQLSSGVLQQMNAGNTGAGPASPQLSSQTLGSVNSITSSPMDLQGVSNKANSINNNVQ